MFSDFALRGRYVILCSCFSRNLGTCDCLSVFRHLIDRRGFLCENYGLHMFTPSPQIRCETQCFLVSRRRQFHEVLCHFPLWRALPPVLRPFRLVEPRLEDITTRQRAHGTPFSEALRNKAANAQELRLGLQRANGQGPCLLRGCSWVVVLSAVSG